MNYCSGRPRFSTIGWSIAKARSSSDGRTTCGGQAAEEPNRSFVCRYHGPHCGDQRSSPIRSRGGPSNQNLANRSVPKPIQDLARGMSSPFVVVCELPTPDRARSTGNCTMCRAPCRLVIGRRRRFIHLIVYLIRSYPIAADDAARSDATWITGCR